MLRRSNDRNMREWVWDPRGAEAELTIFPVRLAWPADVLAHAQVARLCLLLHSMHKGHDIVLPHAHMTGLRAHAEIHAGVVVQLMLGWSMQASDACTPPMKL